MATIRTFDKNDKKAYAKWLKSKPPVIQEMAKKIPPEKLYRLKTSNHRVTIFSYNENGTMTVVVSGKYNFVDFERRVFGIRPEELEECDLPGPEEPVGAILNSDEIDDIVNLHSAGEERFKAIDRAVAVKMFAKLQAMAKEVG